MREVVVERRELQGEIYNAAAGANQAGDIAADPGVHRAKGCRVDVVGRSDVVALAHRGERVQQVEVDIVAAIVGDERSLELENRHLGGLRRPLAKERAIAQLRGTGSSPGECEDDRGVHGRVPGHGSAPDLLEHRHGLLSGRE